MAVVRYSVRAERDLTVIADFTLKRWGEDQVIRYLDGLEACCQNLAVSPALGRTCTSGPAFGEWSLVSRILHQGMLPGRQPMGPLSAPKVHQHAFQARRGQLCHNRIGYPRECKPLAE